MCCFTRESQADYPLGLPDTHHHRGYFSQVSNFMPASDETELFTHNRQRTEALQFYTQFSTLTRILEANCYYIAPPCRRLTQGHI